MQEFRFTFGVQYAHEPHPVPWVHPDGWLAVEAPNEDMARALVYQMMGEKWAFCYAENDPRCPTIERYPLGELRKFAITIKEKASDDE